MKFEPNCVRRLPARRDRVLKKLLDDLPAFRRRIRAADNCAIQHALDRCEDSRDDAVKIKRGDDDDRGREKNSELWKLGFRDIGGGSCAAGGRNSTDLVSKSADRQMSLRLSGKGDTRSNRRWFANAGGRHLLRIGTASTIQ